MDARRIVLPLAVAGLAYAGWSALHEDDALRARADDVACQGRVCRPELAKKTRDLFGWTYAYVVYGDRTRTVSVTCTRAFWLFGEYRCDVSESNSAVDVRYDDR